MVAKKTDGYMNMELLRFAAVGSVDDGKSTLIGRLLYDSKSIFQDQLDAISKASERRGEAQLNLALLTDGLRAEREQGITIDVAYRYFATPKRKFIITDTPGHLQYTRNMITGASNANLALILIDARKGVIEQTKRHSFIASLLKIPHLVVCINKMDLVDYSEDVFEEIKDDYKSFASKLEVQDVNFIPICALHGDNVVNGSDKMPWYKNSPLLYLLETIHISSDENLIDCRFPVQYIIRPNNQEYHDYRAYAGKVVSGIFKPGDKVMILPSKIHTQIKSIETYEGPVTDAFAPMSISMCLAEDVDVSRGDMIVRQNNVPTVARNFEAMLCWFNENKLAPGKKYAIRHTTREARCIIKEIRYKVDINTLHRLEGLEEIGMNDVARVSISTTQSLFIDKYKINRATGSFILIDESTNETVGAGMIL
ncbi:MAG: GTP-binding protein [Bacteroidales bacterium]|jgi:sulfate adenylyltransferase subunit 1|nr:GTP-binding protein [Bacteroidales bacterium]